MPTPRRAALLASGAVLLAAAAWFGLRLLPDTALIGPDVKAYRVMGGDGPLGPARIDLPFTRSSDLGTLNVGVDFNGDGRIADYETVGGARQAERIVRDAPVKVAAGRQSFPFEIVDADLLGRNNFKVTAVLTKDRRGTWSGEAPLGSAVRRAIVPAITRALP